ncbi:MAG: hypothetical protein ACE5GO_10825 [Anaerolineales bacterium]
MVFNDAPLVGTGMGLDAVIGGEPGICEGQKVATLRERHPCRSLRAAPF